MFTYAVVVTKDIQQLAERYCRSVLWIRACFVMGFWSCTVCWGFIEHIWGVSGQQSLEEQCSSVRIL